MVSLARYFPLPFICQHEAYKPGATDAHGNEIPDWWPPVVRSCTWWSPNTDTASYEPPSPPTGGDRIVVDLVLVIDSTAAVDHRDRFTIAGLTTPVDRDGHIVLEAKVFTVVGLPKDYNHGPFGFAPDRVVVGLKWVDG